MRPLNRPIRSSQRGYSLVELSIALAIIAVIVVGGLMGTRQILLSNNINNQLKDSAQVLTKITRQYQKQNVTTGATVATLAPLGTWPAERTTNTNGVWTVRGVIGGTSELVFSNTALLGSLPANQGLIYVLRNVPSAACADIVNGLDPLAFAIYAGAAATADPTTGATPTTTAVKVADAQAVNMANLAVGCSNANPLVDIAAVVKL